MRKRLLLALAAAVAACFAGAAPASAKTVWLCKPGAADNPCTPSLSTTRVSPTGENPRVERIRRPRNPPVDCFYVYPTVSDDQGPQANRSIDPELRSIALYQAARYSRYCKVYAPVYRQITLQGLLRPATITPAMQASAYADVRSAWREYLRRYNKGRGVLLLSHSQGTYVMRRLIPDEIDTKPAVRRRLIAAYLLGGNVEVKKGEDDGGDFKNVPACRSATQLGCVVAYSIFGGPVPDGSLFGTTTAGGGSLFGTTSGPGREVLCTNPASLRGGSGNLDVIEPSEPFAPNSTIGGLTAQIGVVAPPVSTAWIEADDAYRARCVTDNGANVLRATPRDGAPTLRALPAETWGLHLTDANLPLGNLAALFRRQIASYRNEQMAE